MRQKLINYYAPVLVWMVFIFIMSSLPTFKSAEINWLDFVIKKMAHLTEYAILFILTYRAFKNTTKLTFINLVLISLVIVFLYAASDEYHQTFTSGRDGNSRDIMIDLVGALIGLLLRWTLLPKAPGKLKSWVKNWQII